MKRCLTSFLIREMQNKTIMRYHLTQIRMAIIKKSTNNKCWRGFREKGIFLYCWWKINCYNHYGKQYWCSSKTKYRTTTVYSRPTPGHLSRENHNSERQCTHPSDHCRSFYNGSNLKFHWQRNGSRSCGTYIQWNITQP